MEDAPSLQPAPVEGVCVYTGGRWEKALVSCSGRGTPLSRNPAPWSSWQRLPPPGAPTFQQVLELELLPPPPVPPAARATALGSAPYSPAPPDPPGGARCLPRALTPGGASRLSSPPRALPVPPLLSQVSGSSPFHLFPQKGRILVLATFLGPWQAWAPAEAIQRGAPGPYFAEREL